MIVPFSRRLPALLLTATLAGAAVAVPEAASAAGASAPTLASCPRPRGAVTCSPRTLTPSLPVHSAKTFQIRQLATCGGLIYAAGTFTEIVSPNTSGHGTATFRRNNVFSFHATRPYRVTSWNPNVNGVVNTIAVGGKNCATAYLGGSFSKVHGHGVHNLAAVSTATGAVRTGFRSNANKIVDTVLLRNGRLLTGGYFTAINGSLAHYYVGLNATSGIPDTYLRLNISGNYQYQGVAANATRVHNQQLSPDGTRMLVEGDFTAVGGQPRQQIFMLSLGRTHAAVTGWTSPEFSQPCSTAEPFYLRDAAWGPTGTSIYTAATGYAPLGSKRSDQRSGLCDAVARFPVTETSVSPFWVNYTGCDSLYSVAAGFGTVYVGGHERWARNNYACDAEGPGSVSAQGMAGFVENTGRILKARDGKGLYVRSRGLGADDMMLTGAGLWIASDNQTGTSSDGKPYTSQMCQSVSGRAGICFLPS
jgi:hypothetical protein